METSLLRTPLYCKYPSIADTSGVDMSLLRTPLSLYCKHPLIADISGMEMSLLWTPLIYTFLLRTLLWTPL